MRLLLLPLLLLADPAPPPGAPAPATAPAPAASPAPVPAAAATPAVEPPPNEEALRAALLEERSRFAGLLDRKQSVLDAIDRTQQELDRRTRALRLAQERTRKAEGQLAEADRALDTAEQALLARIEQLRPRLLARYRLSRGGTAAFLLQSRSLADLLWRRRTLDRVLQADLTLLEEARTERTRFEEARTRRSEAHQTLQAEQAALATRLTESQAERTRLEAQVRTVEGQAAAREKVLTELAAQAARLEGLSAAPAPSTKPYVPRVVFDQRRGKWKWPVAGPIEVKFGRQRDLRLKTVLQMKGVDLRAEAGVEVAAVAPGRVIHAAWMKGYGNLVVLDHGSAFFSLYAHLQGLEVEAGRDLAEGEPLGHVGDTGSLKGAHLHFELRHHGLPLDPERWLLPRAP